VVEPIGHPIHYTKAMDSDIFDMPDWHFRQVRKLIAYWAL